MSNHELINDIKNFTSGEHLKEWAAERTEAVKKGETILSVELNGVPLHPKLHEFLVEYFKVYRGLSFGVTHGTRWHWYGKYNAHRVCREVWIYKDNERYARGRIGYGPFRVDNDSEDVYMVYDRTIKNNKYRPDRRQHHMMLTSDVKSALKHAYKYLKPYHIMEVAELDRGNFCDSLQQVVQHKFNLAKAFFEDKLKTDGILRELRNMIVAGHKFSPDSFHDNLVTYFNKQDDLIAAKQKNTKAYYVFIKVGEDNESYADILEATDIARSSYQTATYTNPTTVKMSDIPVDIAGKLAVINMLEPKHYCEGVGMKISSEAFWVERE